MKIVGWIFGITILLLLCIYGILFTNFGNSLLKPYVQNLLQQKTNTQIVLNKFKVGLTTVEISADINQELNLSISGDYNLFKKDFDLKYVLNANGLKSFGLNVKEEMGLKGALSGNLNNFIANGAGNTFGSNIKFTTKIIDFKPSLIKLDAKNLNVEDILISANQKPYLNGKLNLIADISDTNGTRLGFAKVTSSKLYTNNTLVKEDFNITLDDNFYLNLNSDIKVLDQIATAKTVLSSPIAIAAALNSIYDINKNELNSDFNLNIPNLNKLEKIINHKLSGEITLKGDIKISASKLEYFDALIKGFGGNINAKLKDDQITAELKDIKLDEVLKVAMLPNVANGLMEGAINIKDISSPSLISGIASLRISKAKIQKDSVNELLNIGINKDIPFNSDVKISVDKGLLNLDSIITSEILNLNKLNGKYNLAQKSGDFDFILDINDLSKLTNQNLKGTILLNGAANIRSNALKILNLNGNLLGGNIDIALNNQNLKANLNSISLNDLFVMTGQKPLANGILNADLNFDSIDIKNLNGKGILNIKNGSLNSKNISQILKKNIPEDVKFELNTKPTITNSIVYFSSNLNSNLIDITKFNGSFDINKMLLDAVYNAKIDDLSKLEFLSGKKLIGAANLDGKIKYDKNLYATLKSKLLNSELNSELEDNKLSLNMNNFDISELLAMLDYEKFYSGKGNLNANYNLESAKGNFKIDILEGSLTKSGLTDAISVALDRDITKEVYKDGYIKGDINRDLVTLKAEISSPKSDINITRGTLNLANSKIFIPVDLNIEKTDLRVEVSGTTQKPRYAFDSNYIKLKIEKELNKVFKTDENATKQNNAKELIKGLKNLF